MDPMTAAIVKALSSSQKRARSGADDVEEEPLSKKPQHPPSRERRVDLPLLPQPLQSSSTPSSSSGSSSSLVPVYPSSQAALTPLPASQNGTRTLPFAPPSDLVANSQGHVLPSAFNIISLNSKQVPAAQRMFAAPRPDVPVKMHSQDVEQSYPSSVYQQHLTALKSIPKSKAEEIGYALKSYHSWCAMAGIIDKDRFPITTLRLRFFLSSFLGVYRLETVKKKVHALKEYSQCLLIDWFVEESELSLVYSAIKSSKPHLKLKCPPLLAQHVKKILEHVQERGGLEDNYELAMLSLTLFGFGGAMRSGEVTVSQNEPTSLEWEKKTRLKDIKENEDGRLVVELPWDKANGFTGRRVPIVEYEFGTKEVFTKHVSQNSISGDDFPFSFLSTRGKLKGKLVPITKLKWTRWFNEQIKELGMTQFKGHSMRIGGATQLLLDGIEPSVVKVIGGWKSDDSFMLYWRHVDALIKTGQIGAGRTVPEELGEAFVFEA